MGGRAREMALASRACPAVSNIHLCRKNTFPRLYELNEVGRKKYRDKIHFVVLSLHSSEVLEKRARKKTYRYRTVDP